MKISLNRVRDGKNAEFRFSYDLDFGGLLCSFDRPFKKPVHVSGILEERADVASVSLSIDAPVETSCARCAKEIHFTHHTDADYMVSEEKPADENDDTVVYAKNGELDVDEIAKTALLLSMDMVYLCKEDCKGLCSKCGADLNEGPCECKKEIDPRIQKLQDLLDK